MSGGGSQSSTQTVEPNSIVKPHLNNIYNAAAERFQSGGPSYYEGDTVAGPSAATTQGQELALGAIPGINDVNAANSDILSELATSDPTQSEFYQNAVEASINPIVSNFKRNILPGLDSGAVAQGAFGGARANLAKGVAIEGLNKQVGDISSKFAFDAYNLGNSNRRFASASVPQVLQNSLLPAQIASGVGVQKDQFAQDKIDADVDRFNFNERRPDFNINQFLNQLSGIPGSTATSRTSGGGSNTATVAGLAALLGGAL